MSQLLLQVIIVVAFGAFCSGCGYLTGVIVTREKGRDEMIKCGVARSQWPARMPPLAESQPLAWPNLVSSSHPCALA